MTHIHICEGGGGQPAPPFFVPARRRWQATLVDLFQDPNFLHLYSGGADSDVWRDGQVIRLLGVAFVTTTEAPQQVLALTGQRIRRAIVCGRGALAGVR